MTAQFNPHALNRIGQRLAGLVGEAQINKALAIATKRPVGKFYVTLKKFAKSVHLSDTENDNINGDIVVAVVRDGKIATIMLTKSWRPEYFFDGTFIH